MLTDHPMFDDPGGEVSEPPPPEVKRGRGRPVGTTSPRKKDHVDLHVRLATDCYQWLEFIKNNGDAFTITEVLEQLIRSDMAAHKPPE
jgi:hypothetical protein